MRRVLIGLAMLFALASSAQASGMLIPADKALPPLALVDQKVTINIEDQVAVTRIEQAFRNHTSRELEAAYLFPVPKGASVRKFTLWVNGVETPGEVVEADIARKMYTEIVSRTQDPALLQYMNHKLVKLQVKVQPKVDQRVSVSYTSVCTLDNGLIEYVHPMKTDGKSAQTLEKFSINVNLKSQHALTNIYSPSHAITIQRPNDKQAVIGFEKSEAILDRDFQLFYQAGSKDIGLTAVTHRPNADKPGYFMLLLSPRAELSKAQQVPRDFVYVIDTSGSMRIGNRIGQAKNALKYCLRSLTENDRFTMINFASQVTKYSNNLNKATPDNIEEARKWVDALEPTGGTAIDDALRVALELRPKEAGRTYTVVFFTDGQPTWGERDPLKIIANVKKNNTGNTRIFSFGVGNDVNTVLLDSIADNTRAVSSYVRETEDIEAKVSSLYAKISNPVLADLKLSYGDNVKISEVYPPQLPDMFHGTQIVVFGRYTGNGKATIKLTGTVGKETKEFTYDIDFSDKTAENKSFVEDLWARRKVGYLLDQLRVQGDSKEVVEEVIALAKRYGIATPYTSYLLVPDAPPRAIGAAPGQKGPGVPLALQPGFGGNGTDPKAPPTPVAKFAKGVAGKSAKGGGVADGRTQLETDRLNEEAKKGNDKDKKAAKEALDQQSSLQKAEHAFRRNLLEVQQGKIGVDFAVRNNDLRSQQQLTRSASKNVQNRNLVEVGGVWIDEAFDPKMETVTIKSQSAAYFRLLERQPMVKDVYLLGNYVVWVTPSGRALIIDRNSGSETLPDADIDRLFVAPTKQ